MNGDLESWLITSPLVTRISLLALDAAAMGLIDLRKELAAAVARQAFWNMILARHGSTRVRTEGTTKRIRHRGRMVAKVRKRNALRLNLEAGVAQLHGDLSDGATISGGADRATLHLADDLPHTIIAALPRGRLSRLGSAPLLDARPYLICRATRLDRGIDFEFNVETVAVPCARDRQDWISSWSGAREDEGLALLR